MRKMLRISIAALAATLASSMAPGLLAAAEIEWRMHTVFVPTRDEAKVFQNWVDRVNERSGDRLRIELFAGGSLNVKDVDILRVLPSGNVIQVVGLYPGYLSRDAPTISSLLPPGVLSDTAQALQIFPELKAAYDKIYDGFGVKLLSLVVAQNKEYNIFCKEPINTLDQLRHKKLRVHERSLVMSFSDLGVAAQIIPQNDQYMALQTGVVDCAYYAIGYAKTVSLQEVTPYSAFITPYAIQPLNLIVAKEAFEALPADLQAILTEEAARIEQEQVDRFDKGEWEAQEIEAFEAAGGKVIEPFSEDDRRAYNDASRKAWQVLAKEAGADAEANLSVISKALKLDTE